METLIQNQNRVAAFSVFNEEVGMVLTKGQLSEFSLKNNAYILSLLNGKASEVLQKTVSLKIRRESGIFFTSHELSNKLAWKISNLLSKGIKVVDPACGAGDLLLACAQYLPLGKNLGDTINKWSELVSGFDLYDEFILATKLRLILLAAARSKDSQNIENYLLESKVFTGLVKKDFISDKNDFREMVCFVVNPPFGDIDAPNGCKWATGKIQTAARFMEKLFIESNPGQQILAILPDVLRSGTRYSKWRKVIGQFCSNLEIESAGRFDAGTDVDVFILQATMRFKNEINVTWPDNSPIINYKYSSTVSDYFNVCVGTIVPYRDPDEGTEFPYLHAKNAEKGQIINSLSETILTKRKCFHPPFVVVHRTSSPNDTPRCVTSIVNIKNNVAVENHLIILKPKNNQLELCHRLVKILNSSITDTFLNQRIRCRHLTVASVKEIPWVEE